MKTLENPIKVVNLIPNAVLDTDTTGTGVDMQAGGGFDAALVTVDVGAINGTPDSVAISVVESDSANMSGATTVLGGDAVNVDEETAYTFQVERRKRYLAVKVDFTGGTTPDAAVSAVGILNNWARPFPLR